MERGSELFQRCQSLLAMLKLFIRPPLDTATTMQQIAPLSTLQLLKQPFENLDPNKQKRAGSAPPKMPVAEGVDLAAPRECN